ncbi:molybdenum ABC transporter ATP-binding protein [Chlorobium sp. N1]|uniref:molybdenum ABC transporter ATP-binding protein n=1 Tax=Chlorobium sp. N1 TaxID=2491138 RepID=UPI001040433B|nr:molybdenum ABC transporter ATP-binding protein [Chlorobium sp. N1]TCD48834.1 molybdenum ABC transporter ATP-binding protein [Chlorobium sp. N1]
MKLRFEAEKDFGSFRFEAATEVEGRTIGIFGQSGSGKSTLVHLVAGLLQPDRGEIFLDGDCLFSSSRGVNLSPRKRRVGLVFQHAALFPHLSVRSNLLYGYRRTKSEHRRIDPGLLIDALGLGGLMQRGVGTLSGGEKQRVALGRAVLANPRLLLMDEPLSALDDTLRFQIIPYLKRVSEEFAVPALFISHSVIEMQLLADRVLTIHGGTVTGECSPDALARSAMAENRRGYTNLLQLSGASPENGLFRYRWGENCLQISDGRNGGSALYELSSRDIILFRNHPEAISARNLLECRVAERFAADHRVGVVLESGGRRLVAEIVRDAAEELGVREGATVFAAIKASSFRRLL